MFGAIGRWLKAFGYLVTGQIDAAREVLDTNPHVIRAKYDSVIRDKTDRIHQYRSAVAQLITQEEQKLGKLKTLTEDVGRLERLKEGALAKARTKVKELQAAGKSQDEIHADEDYRKCLSAYNDFNATLSEKQERIGELEADIEQYGKTIADHKLQLQELMRELDRIRAESADAVAEVITAQQEKEIADTLSGIAQDGTAEELQRLRQMRQELKAEARVAREMAGTDSQAQEAEFLKYARETESSDEFDALIGLAESAPDESAPTTTEKSSLPE